MIILIILYRETEEQWGSKVYQESLVRRFGQDSDFYLTRRIGHF